MADWVMEVPRSAKDCKLDVVEEGNEEEALEIPEVRANDIISIVYETNSSFVSKPTYTHQLFDKEKIALSSSDAKIELRVSLQNMAVTMSTSKCSSDEINFISEKLAPVMPSCTLPPEFVPPGRKLATHVVNDVTYTTYLATAQDMHADILWTAAQKLALFYIETAECIDFNSDQWELVTIYASHPTDASITYVAGYTTLFTFRNPIRGAKVRICQMLLFPPYQRLSLGRLMMLDIYDVMQSRNEVTEVTVEDPCQEYQNLRDAVDIEYALKLYPDMIRNGIYNDVAFTDACKLTSRQQQFVRKAVEYYCCNTNNKRPIDDMKSFRLSVKRLLLSYAPELKEVAKTIMQKQLQAMYDEFEMRLERVRRKEYVWTSVMEH